MRSFKETWYLIIYIVKYLFNDVVKSVKSALNHQLWVWFTFFFFIVCVFFIKAEIFSSMILFFFCLFWSIGERIYEAGHWKHEMRVKEKQRLLKKINH